jgi:hypothetical protein
MRVLLTGNEGYIGTILVPWLRARNHEVIGLDSGLFRECTLRSAIRPVPTIRKDVRDAELRDRDGIDAVIHLAGLSNDPLGSLNPRLTFEINHEAPVRLADAVGADHARWRGWLEHLRRADHRTVLWGGGSKGVSFLDHARHPGRHRLRGRRQPAPQRHLHRRDRAADHGSGVPGGVPARRRDHHVADLRPGDPAHLERIGAHPSCVVTVEAPEPLEGCLRSIEGKHQRAHS